MDELLIHDVDYMKLLYENKDVSVYELDAIHLGENPNGMNIDMDCAVASLPSFANMPIYGVIDNKWNPLDGKNNDFLEHFREKFPDRITRDRILPFGCIPESAVSDAKFVDRDGKTYLRLRVVIWKKLLPHVSQILQRRGEVKISVEFSIKSGEQREDGIIDVHEFKIYAITAIGEKFKEVMQGARIKQSKASYTDYIKESNSNYFSFASQKYYEIPKDVLSEIKDGVSIRRKTGRGGTKSNFSYIESIAESGVLYESQVDDFKNYFESLKDAPSEENPPTGKFIVYKMYGGEPGRIWVEEVLNKNNKEGGNSMEDKTIKINNEKEDAVNSAGWENPGKDLYEPILKAENKDFLVKEAYLVVEDGYEDAPSEKLKYPHHSVEDDELVLNIAGVKAAFARASQMGIVEGAVKAHLERHYRELGLDMENFAVKCAEYEKVISEKDKLIEEYDEKFSKIESDYNAKCSECDDINEKYASITTKMSEVENELCSTKESLSKYIRNEEIAKNKELIEEYKNCFDESMYDEVNEFAEKATFAEMKDKISSLVMSFAKEHCVNNVENDFKFSVNTLNPYYNFNARQKEVKKTNDLDAILKKSKTKVI